MSESFIFCKHVAGKRGNAFCENYGPGFTCAICQKGARCCKSNADGRSTLWDQLLWHNHFSSTFKLLQW